MENKKFNVEPAMLPQLIGTLNKDGEYVLPVSVVDTLVKVRKVSSEDPNQIVFTGYSSFESVPCYDKKAFRYLSKDGIMFLCERCESMGGAAEQTVLTELGGFTAGTELNPDFTEIAKIKEGKARQRKQQLEETERLAKRAMSQINKIVPEEIKTEFNKQCEEMKRFVRIGKPDFYASQLDIIKNLAVNTPEVTAICSDYAEKVANKNQKWVTAKLKEPKAVKDYADRIGTKKNEGIGEIDPSARERFNEYYAKRVPQILPYLLQENEEIIEDVPEPPKEIFVKYTEQIDVLNAEMTQGNEAQTQAEEIMRQRNGVKIQEERATRDSEIQIQKAGGDIQENDISIQEEVRDLETKKDLEDGGMSV